MVLAAEGWVVATAEVSQDWVALAMAAGALDKVVAESCLLMRWCWPHEPPRTILPQANGGAALANGPKFQWPTAPNPPGR